MCAEDSRTYGNSALPLQNRRQKVVNMGD